MEELNVNSNINQLENLELSKSVNIDQVKLVKLAMEKVKQSIYQKSGNDSEIMFILKRL
jgi:hypothetical protein